MHKHNRIKNLGRPAQTGTNGTRYRLEHKRGVPAITTWHHHGYSATMHCASSQPWYKLHMYIAGVPLICGQEADRC
jgi:hypothetical protein